MKIGIVNDLPLAVEALRQALAISGDYQVIWVAIDGEQAVRECAQNRPDLVLMDLIMPVMDGVEATRQIMLQSPCAILVVTASVGINAHRVFDAMAYGALDAVDVPVLNVGTAPANAAPFLAKLDSIRRLLEVKPANIVPQKLAAPTQKPSLLVIGASAGGPAALATLLSGIPKNFPMAIVIVQHIDRMFANGMADWLSKQATMPIKIIQHGDIPLPGTVWLAGTNDHLALLSDGRMTYVDEPIAAAYRPSIDVFFNSVVRYWQGNVAGILLTGMGHDGASGLKALRDKGHYTVAQDQATSVVYGMPKAAANLNAAVDILPIEEIAPHLLKWNVESSLSGKSL